MKKYQQPITEIVTVSIQTLLTASPQNPTGAVIYDDGFSSSSEALSREHKSIWDEEE